jgi:hypothetical protein
LSSGAVSIPGIFHRKSTVKHASRWLSGAGWFFLAAMVTAYGTLAFQAQSYGLSLAAGLTVSIVGSWTIYWGSQWVRRFRISRTGEVIVVVGVGLLIATAICLLYAESRSFLIAMSNSTRWLIPFGWANELVWRIGNREFVAVGPLAIWLAVMAVAGVLFRSQAKSMAQMRRILILADPHSFVRDEPQRRDQPTTSATIQREVRDELRFWPRPWSRVFFPTWVAESRGMLIITAALFLLVQAFLLASQWILGDRSEVDDIGRHETLVLHQLALASVAFVVGAVEFIGFIRQDLMSMDNFPRRCISIWGFWRRVQMSGLRRFPTLLLFASLSIVGPIVVLQSHAAAFLQTVLLALLVLIALRTAFVAYVALADCIGECQLPTPLKYAAGVVAYCSVWLFFLLTAFSIIDMPHLPLSAIEFQIALQFASLAVLGVAAWSWYRVFSGPSNRHCETRP